SFHKSVIRNPEILVKHFVQKSHIAIIPTFYKVNYCLLYSFAFVHFCLVLFSACFQLIIPFTNIPINSHQGAKHPLTKTPYSTPPYSQALQPCKTRGFFRGLLPNCPWGKRVRPCRSP